jgi:hypothetical protein
MIHDQINPSYSVPQSAHAPFFSFFLFSAFPFLPIHQLNSLTQPVLPNLQPSSGCEGSEVKVPTQIPSSTATPNGVTR